MKEEDRHLSFMNNQPTTVSPPPLEEAKKTHPSNDEEMVAAQSPSLKVTSESETQADQTESKNPPSKPHPSGVDGNEEAALRRSSVAPVLQDVVITSTTPPPPPPSDSEAMVEVNGRERLKRHRVEVAGRVWIPDIWGQEGLLKDWIDCTGFDASMVKSSNIMSARAALVKEGRIRANSSGLRIDNRC